MKNKILLTVLALLSMTYGYAQLNVPNGQINAGGTNDMQLRTNATTRLTIMGTNGQVGINTSMPADFLDVNGNVRATQFNAVSGTYNTIGATNLSFNTNNVNRLTILNTNGFVGVGTVTPTEMLTVNGNALATQYASTNGNYNAAGTSNFTVQTNNTPRLTVLNSNGFVGVGKVNPAFALDVNGPINATAINVNGAPFTPTSSQWSTVGSTINYGAGNVGIGKTNPAFTLDVNGAINATALNVNGVPFTPISSQWNTSGTTINYSSGNVGIGKSAPAFALDVNGVVNASGININGVPFTPVSSQWTTSGTTINFTTGNVGIGTALASNPNNYKLAVNGSIGAKDMRVEKTSATWPDYVFEKSYELPSLNEVETYITKNNHLKDVPSAKEVEQNGHSLGDMDAVLLKKVEELTLYVIQQQKEIEALKKKLEEKK